MTVCRRWLKEAQKELESLSNAERQLEQAGSKLPLGGITNSLW